jgi:hypothetical protein
MFIGAVFAAALALPAYSQEGTPRAPSEKTRFGIKAANDGKSTLEDGHFAYDVPAGTTVEDGMVLINYSDENLVFNVYPADMDTAVGGGLAPAQRNTEMEHVGKWLTLDNPELSTVGVGPDSRRTVPFTLRVPEGTPPGDYPGAMVAALDVGGGDRGLGVQTRAALLVRLTVPGKTNLKVTVGDLRSQTDDGDGIRFDVDVRNRGNVLFTMIGEVEVRKGGTTVATVPLSPKELYVIPEGEATLSGVWKDPPSFGRVKAVARIHTFINQRPAETFSSKPVTLTIVPWQKVAMGSAIIALLAGMVLFGRKRLNRWRSRRREEKEIVRQHRAEPQVVDHEQAR